MSLLAHAPVEAASRRYVGFAPDNGRQAGVPGRIVELHCPVHYAMVREGDGRRAVLGGPPAKAVDTACPVQ